MRDLIPVSALQADAAPFTDVNFKLTVLSRLIETGALRFGDFVEFLGFVEGPTYNYEEHGYEASAKALDYLTRYPIPAAALTNLEELWFDGGIEIYPYVFPFWRGETEEFDVNDLTDLRVLPNLKNFAFSSMLRSNSLSPLRPCQKLEEVELGLIGGSWRDPEVLLDLSKLRYLQAYYEDMTSPKAKAVLDQLHTRGVAIDIFKAFR